MPSDQQSTRSASQSKYRARAARYDETCGPTWRYRERAIAALALRVGDVVLDAGCGTGLSFGLLRERVGDLGGVVGVEHSAEMAALARERVAREGWRNVRVLEAAAQDVAIGCTADALLFNYTHDICRSPAGVRNLLSQARDGARVGMAGVKYFPWWAAPLNAWVYAKNRLYNGLPGELRAPWDIVQIWVPGLVVESTQFGMGYVAWGVMPIAPGGPGIRSGGGTQSVAARVRTEFRNCR